MPATPPDAPAAALAIDVDPATAAFDSRVRRSMGAVVPRRRPLLSRRAGSAREPCGPRAAINAIRTRAAKLLGGTVQNLDPEALCRLYNLESRSDVELVRPIARPATPAPARAEPCQTGQAPLFLFGRSLGLVAGRRTLRQIAGHYDRAGRPKFGWTLSYQAQTAGHGSGLAIGVIDYCVDFDLWWTIMLDSNGEVWWVPHPHVRFRLNPRAGRVRPDQKETNHPPPTLRHAVPAWDSAASRQVGRGHDRGRTSQRDGWLPLMREIQVVCDRCRQPIAAGFSVLEFKAGPMATRFDAPLDWCQPCCVAFEEFLRSGGVPAAEDRDV